MGTSVASEPLNSDMIYDPFIVFSSCYMTAPLEMVAWATSRIYLIIYLNDITNIENKCAIKLAQNNFLA